MNKPLRGHPQACEARDQETQYGDVGRGDREIHLQPVDYPDISTEAAIYPSARIDPTGSLTERSPHSDLGTPLRVPYLPDFFDAPATNPNPKTKAKSTKRIAQKCPPPLNILGGGAYRFAGAKTEHRAQSIADAIDAEVGVPAAASVVSADGVVTSRIPSRRAR